MNPGMRAPFYKVRVAHYLIILEIRGERDFNLITREFHSINIYVGKRDCNKLREEDHLQIVDV